jgi:hypothetical protein
MQACLHVSGEGVSSQKFFSIILFCLRRFKSIAPQTERQASESYAKRPPLPIAAQCAAIDLPRKGGGED